MPPKRKGKSPRKATPRAPSVPSPTPSHASTEADEMAQSLEQVESDNANMPPPPAPEAVTEEIVEDAEAVEDAMAGSQPSSAAPSVVDSEDEDELSISIRKATKQGKSKKSDDEEYEDEDDEEDEEEEEATAAKRRRLPPVNVPAADEAIEKLSNAIGARDTRVSRKERKKKVIHT
jgi:hypothetical protein